MTTATKTVIDGPRIDTLTVVWEPDFGVDGGNSEGCYIKARVSYAIGRNSDRRLEWLSSGGLWGIEGADSAYAQEVQREQLVDQGSRGQTMTAKRQVEPKPKRPMKCGKCGHKWNCRLPEDREPQECPNCKNRRWNR